MDYTSRVRIAENFSAIEFREKKMSEDSSTISTAGLVATDVMGSEFCWARSGATELSVC